MRDPYGRIRLIDMLASRAAGPVSIDPDIFIGDLHIQVFVNLRHHVTGCKGGLPLSRRVKRRNSHQPVNASLGP